MIPVQYQRIQTRKWPALVIFGIPLLPFYIGYTPADFEITAWMTGVIVVVIAIFYVVLSRKNITLDDNSITQQSVFGKDIELPWREIKRIGLSWEHTNHGMGLSMEIEVTPAKKISFDPTTFSRKSIGQILDALSIKCPGALFDEKTRKMCEGRFPWYVF